MPEGPSIVILKEEVQPFTGKKVIKIEGNTKTPTIRRIEGRHIVDFKSWGKHFLICFQDFTVQIHFMLFGSYLINERKEGEPRLSLQFEDNRELNFYACLVHIIEEPLDIKYDWSADVMNPVWNPDKAFQKLKLQPYTMVCDAILDQHIFAGAGNIIKNEVLFRICVHPESLLGKMPEEKLKVMIKEVVKYSFEFLAWKREYTLKKHWLAHTKIICPRDHVPFQKGYLGKSNRRSFYCTLCQQLYI